MERTEKEVVTVVLDIDIRPALEKIEHLKKAIDRVPQAHATSPDDQAIV